jgi:CheY-like chemotaxis protein
MEEVKDKMEKGGFTHLFIAANVYRSEPVFIDKIASVKPVCVFGEPDFRLRKGSMATVISKPIFTLNVVNFLRNTADGVSEKVVISKEDYSGKLALVVDDDDMNLMVANGVLSQMGVESETANSGEASIEMCSSKNYDIIFMDYMMPEMNGIKAMRAIREIKGGRYKNVPIIVLTANAVSSAREDFKREGFDDFISKPIESVSLKKIISKYLGKGVER